MRNIQFNWNLFFQFFHDPQKILLLIIFFFPIVIFSTLLIAIADVTVSMYSVSGRNIILLLLLLSLSIIVMIIIIVNIIIIINSFSLYSLYLFVYSLCLWVK